MSATAEPSIESLFERARKVGVEYADTSLVVVEYDGHRRTARLGTTTCHATTERAALVGVTSFARAAANGRALRAANVVAELTREVARCVS